MYRPITDYLIKSPKGRLRLTNAFFEASLQEKYELVAELETLGTLFEDMRVYDLIVKAILQHSPDKSKRQYVVKGVRKQRPKAKKADMRDSFDALFANLDRIAEAMYRNALPELNTKVGPDAW